jgi:hypothetical protein
VVCEIKGEEVEGCEKSESQRVAVDATAWRWLLSQLGVVDVPPLHRTRTLLPDAAALAVSPWAAAVVHQELVDGCVAAITAPNNTNGSHAVALGSSGQGKALRDVPVPEGGWVVEDVACHDLQQLITSLVAVE